MMIVLERTGKYAVNLQCDQDGIKVVERAFVQAFQTGHTAIASQVESNLFNKPASKAMLVVALEIIQSDENVVRLKPGRTIELRLDEETVHYVAHALSKISERGYAFLAELFSATFEKSKQEITFYCHASL